MGEVTEWKVGKGVGAEEGGEGEREVEVRWGEGRNIKIIIGWQRALSD